MLHLDDVFIVADFLFYVLGTRDSAWLGVINISLFHIFHLIFGRLNLVELLK